MPDGPRGNGRPRVKLRSAGGALLLIAAGVAASVLVHAPTLDYGFVYDDYGFLRPHTLAEVLASFHGPWDPRGPNVPFFRPLTVAFHAARFEWFQYDPWRYHLASLVLFGFAAGILGTFVRGVTRSVGVALLAVTFTVVHPHMPYAATAWITNQPHALQLVLFSAALRWWWFCRERSWVWWTPLLLLHVGAFLVKEDGVMLAPLIVAAHVAWTWIAHGRPALPPSPFIGLLLLVGGGMLYWRDLALGGIGGYRTPGWEGARANYWRGFSRTLALLPIDRPGKAFPAAFVVLTSVAGGLAAIRQLGGGLFLWVLGFAVVALCDLPYVFVTKREQWHLLSWGGAILLTGASWSAWRLARAWWWRAACAGCALVAVLSMASVSRQMSADFAPYSSYVLATDRIVTEWAIVPLEIRTFLHDKRTAWDGGRQRLQLPDALRLVSYGLFEEGDAPGWQWASRDVTLFVRPRASILRVPIGAVALPGMPRGPEEVSIRVDGGAIREVALPLGAWTDLDIPLEGAGPGSRRLHRVELSFRQAVVPARKDPSSQDTRELAARVGAMTIH